MSNMVYFEEQLKASQDNGSLDTTPLCCFAQENNKSTKCDMVSLPKNFMVHFVKNMVFLRYENNIPVFKLNEERN